MHMCSTCKQDYKDSDLAVKRMNVKGEPIAWRCKGCTRTANALWRNCGEKARTFQSPHERAAFFAANVGKSAEELMNVATLRSEEYDIQESESEDQAELESEATEKSAEDVVVPPPPDEDEPEPEGEVIDESESEAAPKAV